MTLAERQGLRGLQEAPCALGVFLDVHGHTFMTGGPRPLRRRASRKTHHPALVLERPAPSSDGCGIFAAQAVPGLYGGAGPVVGQPLTVRIRPRITAR